MHLIVRAPELAETMSSYLIRRIEENPAITFHPCTEIVRLSGDGQLARVILRNNLTGKVKTHDIGHVFMMTGATPNTGWLGAGVILDPKGFIKTGSELSSNDLAKALLAAVTSALSSRNEPAG